MELNDTIILMSSADYKDRFRAEYYQTKLRLEKLHRMVVRFEAGTLNFEPTCTPDFKPTCPIGLLKEQVRHMGEYLECLEIRAEIEGIPL